MTLRTLNYGNYGIFLIMGHAGFLPINRMTPSDLGIPRNKQDTPPPFPPFLVLTVEAEKLETQ